MTIKSIYAAPGGNALSPNLVVDDDTGSSALNAELVAHLATLDPSVNPCVSVGGKGASGDQGGGVFVGVLVAGGPAVDNVLVFASSNALWRWSRDTAAKIVDPRWGGAKGDGTTNDRAALAACDALNAGPLHLAAGLTHRVSTNLTLANGIHARGGKLKPDSGITVTVRGVTAGPGDSWIDQSAGGRVAIEKTQVVHPGWFADSVETVAAPTATPTLQKFSIAATSYDSLLGDVYEVAWARVGHSAADMSVLEETTLSPTATFTVDQNYKIYGVTLPPEPIDSVAVAGRIYVRRTRGGVTSDWRRATTAGVGGPAHPEHTHDEVLFGEGSNFPNECIPWFYQGTRPIASAGTPVGAPPTATAIIAPTAAPILTTLEGYPDGTYYGAIGWVTENGYTAIGPVSAGVAVAGVGLARNLDLLTNEIPPHGAVAINLYVGTDPAALKFQGEYPLWHTRLESYEYNAAGAAAPAVGVTPTSTLGGIHQALRAAELGKVSEVVVPADGCNFKVPIHTRWLTTNLGFKIRGAGGGSANGNQPAARLTYTGTKSNIVAWVNTASNIEIEDLWVGDSAGITKILVAFAPIDPLGGCSFYGRVKRTTFQAQAPGGRALVVGHNSGGLTSHTASEWKFDNCGFIGGVGGGSIDLGGQQTVNFVFDSCTTWGATGGTQVAHSYEVRAACGNINLNRHVAYGWCRYTVLMQCDSWHPLQGGTPRLTVNSIYCENLTSQVMFAVTGTPAGIPIGATSYPVALNTTNCPMARGTDGYQILALARTDVFYGPRDRSAGHIFLKNVLSRLVHSVTGEIVDSASGCEVALASGADYASAAVDHYLGSVGFVNKAGDRVYVGTNEFGALVHDGQATTRDTAPPTTGTWAVGDLCYNSAAAFNDPLGWVCYTAGTAAGAKWLPFGAVYGDAYLDMLLLPDMNDWIWGGNTKTTQADPLGGTTAIRSLQGGAWGAIGYFFANVNCSGFGTGPAIVGPSNVRFRITGQYKRASNGTSARITVGFSGDAGGDEFFDVLVDNATPVGWTAASVYCTPTRAGHTNCRVFVGAGNVLDDADFYDITLEQENSPDGYVSPKLQRIMQSPLPAQAADILLTTGTAQFVYLGYTVAETVIKYVEFLVTVAAVGAQTAEIGLFSTLLPPCKAAQSLTKLMATGTVDDLTGTGVMRNTNAFTTAIAAGVHVWAGIRTAMGTTQPTLSGRGGDWAQGQILDCAGSGVLTGAGPFAGAIIAAAGGSQSPDLRGVLD